MKYSHIVPLVAATSCPAIWGCSGDEITSGMTASGGASTGSGGSVGSGGGATSASGGASTGSGGHSAASGGGASGGMASGGMASDGDNAAGGSPNDGSGGGDTTSAGGGDPGSGGATASDETPSMGCGTTPTLTSGSHTIQVGGQSRSFMLRIPDNYDSDHPYRLIFAFHWNGGTMNDVDGGGSSGFTWSYYGLREQAEDSTIFVAPQGLNNGWANSNGRDLDFVDEMVSQIEGDLCIDESRVFSMGFSYGGGMTYGIACDRADVFRAAAVYSGAQLSGCNDGSEPIAYLGIHGVSDGTCNIAGGRALRDRFVGNNQCTPQSPPEPNPGSNTHICTSYEGCSEGNPVRWCAFDGGHTPGPVEGGGDDGALTWTKKEAWQFFSQF